MDLKSSDCSCPVGIDRSSNVHFPIGQVDLKSSDCSCPVGIDWSRNVYFPYRASRLAKLCWSMPLLYR